LALALSLPFLPAIGSSISRWPSIRLLPSWRRIEQPFCGAPERSAFTLTGHQYSQCRRHHFSRRSRNVKFEPENFEDQYDDTLKDLIKKKRKGEKIDRPT
jgi:hypothetical protein